MSARIRAAGAFLLAASILVGSGAQAFQRSRDPQTLACLWWKDRLVEVYLHEDCSTDVPRANCQNAIWSTLDAWNQPVCSDFSFVAGGADGITSRTDVGFDQDNWNDNINLIIWQESTWTYDRSAIALTTTTYDRLTGEIVDSDVEFNGIAFTFTTAESPQTLVDIANTMAHEAGHMLGLDHSSSPDASMWSTAPAGETQKRDLSQDDIDGLCHIYPAGQKIPPCEGFTPPKKDDGCDCGTLGAPEGLWFAVLGMLLFGLRRRRPHPEAR